MRWGRPLLLRSPDGDDGGGGAPPPPPSPVQQAPIPRQQEPQQHQPQQPTGGRADTIADVRAEAASYRIAARQAREQAEDAQRALEALRAQHETEKASVTKPLQTKVERLQQRMIDATVTSKMVAAGLVDPDLVALASKMPDAPKLVLDDNDEVQGVDEMVEKFKKWKPDYFKKAEPGSGRQQTPTPTPTPTPAPTSTSGGREPPPSGSQPVTDVRKMDKKQYAEWKSAQMATLRAAGRG